MNRKQSSAEMILKSSEIKRKTNLVYQNQSKLECYGFLKLLLCLFVCYLSDVQMKRQVIYFLLRVFSIVLPILKGDTVVANSDDDFQISIQTIFNE